MMVNVNGMDMQVAVPPGVQQGQPFTFSVASPDPPMAVAQPVVARECHTQVHGIMHLAPTCERVRPNPRADLPCPLPLPAVSSLLLQNPSWCICSPPCPSPWLANL